MLTGDSDVPGSPDNRKCFVDANISHYHFVETPVLSEPCSDLLERATVGSIEIHTSLHVLAEAVHKVMLSEAEQKLGRTRTGLVNWLQRHRHQISELSEFREAAAEEPVRVFGFKIHNSLI